MSVKEPHVSLRFLRTRRMLQWATTAAPHLARFFTLHPPPPQAPSTPLAITEPATHSWPIIATMDGACHATSIRKPHNTENSVHTLQETLSVSITKTKWLVLFGEIIAAYCDNHAKHIHGLMVHAQSFSLGGGGWPWECIKFMFHFSNHVMKTM
jgi:hypothetical protein